MIIIDEEGASDLPFVERVWRSHSEGVMEAPGGEDSLGERSGWSLPFFSEEAMKVKLDELLTRAKSLGKKQGMDG